jgi:hypothetical protein
VPPPPAAGPWLRRNNDRVEADQGRLLEDLMADPGELDVTCLDCHHNTTMPVAALLPRSAAETPFPEVWGGFRCSACGSQIDARPNWAARQASGQILRP